MAAPNKTVLDFSVVSTSSTPYTDLTKTKKIPRDHVKRPMNAFMLWSQHKRRELRTTSPVHHAKLSQELGAAWRALPEEEKQPFYEAAEELKRLHCIQYPDYKFAPKKKGRPRAKPRDCQRGVAAGRVSKRERTASVKTSPRYVPQEKESEKMADVELVPVMACIQIKSEENIVSPCMSAQIPVPTANVSAQPVRVGDTIILTPPYSPPETTVPLCTSVYTNNNNNNNHSGVSDSMGDGKSHLDSQQMSYPYTLENDLVYRTQYQGDTVNFETVLGNGSEMYYEDAILQLSPEHVEQILSILDSETQPQQERQRDPLLTSVSLFD